MQGDPLLEGMPTQPVRVGVPTALARELITKVVTGFVDQVTLELKNLNVKKSGTVKKVVSIGHYDLQVRIHKVTGKLKTGTPELTFGGNQVKLALPVTVASGQRPGHDQLQVGRQERERRRVRRHGGDPGGLGRGEAGELPGLGRHRPDRDHARDPGVAEVPA